MNTSENFQQQANIFVLFNSEQKIRKNPFAFRKHCYHIFKERNLPLSKIALDFYLNLLNKESTSNKSLLFRKDKKTLREQHEESHVVTADILLKTIREDFIKPEHGSEDAFFAAIVLHDIIEDLNQSGDDIKVALEEGLQKKQIENNPQTKHDVDQIVIMVEALSRKDKDGDRLDNDRIKQAKQWNKHPYCHIIKLIDWCHKLQTMIGVNSFEKDNRKKMSRVLNETSLIFVDEQQNMTIKAIKKYPFIKEACEPMAGIMGMQSHIIRAYVDLRSEDFKFNPIGADPFNFQGYLDKSDNLLRALPKGNNYISPVLERLEEVAEKNSNIQSFLQHMVKPSFHHSALNKDPNKNNKLTYL